MSLVSDIIKLRLLFERTAFFAELAEDTAGEARVFSNFARELGKISDPLDPGLSPARLAALCRRAGMEDEVKGWFECGVLGCLENLRRRYPDTLDELYFMPELSARAVRLLLARGVDSAEELERRCESGEIREWDEFPANFADRAMKLVRRRRRAIYRCFLPEANALMSEAIEALREGNRAAVVAPAGEYRRRRELVSSLDLVMENGEPAETTAILRRLGWKKLPSEPSEWDMAFGLISRKFTYAVHHVPSAYFGARLCLVTGSDGHIHELRRRLLQRGLRLTWHGVLDKQGRLVPCPDEDTLYRMAGLPWIPPELREDRLEWAWSPVTPLVSLEDLRGIAHCHTNWTDGEGSLEEMAALARNIGCRWVAVTDHSAAALLANGLTPDKLREQYAAMDRLNAGWPGFRLIKGIEADILKDGSVDLVGGEIRSSELVIGSVHDGEPETARKNTDRVVRAMATGWIDVLGHPCGRILKGWPGRSLEWDRVFQAAAEWDVAIEINANPRRLDLDWRLIPAAAAKGIRFLIGPDAHRPEGLYNIRFGAAMARKGGLRREHVLNCLDATELITWARERKLRHGAGK